MKNKEAQQLQSEFFGVRTPMPECAPDQARQRDAKAQEQDGQRGFDAVIERRQQQIGAAFQVG